MAIDPVERYGIDEAAARCAAGDRLALVQLDLRRALALELRAFAFPSHPDVRLWRGESSSLRETAAMAFRPEMKRRINLSNQYQWALKDVPDELDGVPARPLPETCRVTLAQLLGFLLPLDQG
jgi:hypothetical protein